MNLHDLNSGTPGGKQWLNLVARSSTTAFVNGTTSMATPVLAVSERASLGQAVSSSLWRAGGTVPLLTGSETVPIPIGSFIGGYAQVAAAAIGSLTCPTSAQVDAFLPTSAVGALFQFTVISQATGAPGAQIRTPNGSFLSIPTGGAQRANSTVFVFQKQGPGDWLCMNDL